MCERHEQLVEYIYDEIAEEDRRELEAHLSACADCRAEVEELRGTRMHLALWAPPEPELGFRVIRGGSAPAPALPRRRFAPAFAFAAAAVILLAVAAAIANVEIRYDAGGVAIRTGWVPADQPTGVVPSPAQPVPTRVETIDTAALDRRIQQIVESALASRPAVTMQAATTSRLSDAALIRRTNEMVAESEARQRIALAQVLMQVLNDFDRQRRTDIIALQQGIGQYQGVTNAEIAHTRDIVNQLMRVATKQEK